MKQGTTVQIRSERTLGRGRRIAFYLTIGLGLLAILITGPVLTLPITAWLSEATLDALFGEEGLGIHRVHMQGASLLFWLTIVAMVVQVRHPESKAAPLWAAAAGWLVFLPLELTHLVDPFSIVVTVLVLVVLALHPRRWPATPINWSPGPRTLAIPYALCAVAYAYKQARLQLNAVTDDPHAVVSHFELMTAIAVALAVSALLGATNFPGHQISTWTAGSLTLVLAVFFVGHPHQMSSAGSGWGTALVVWSLVYLAVSTRSTRSPAARPTGVAS